MQRSIAAPAALEPTAPVHRFGEAAHAATSAAYTEGTGRHVTNDAQYGGAPVDDYSHGRTLGDRTAKAVEGRALKRGGRPADADAARVVLTSADERESNGFGSRYRGWNSHGKIAGADLTFLFRQPVDPGAPRL